MKTTLSLILSVLLLMVVLVSCGKGGNGDETSGTESVDVTGGSIVTLPESTTTNTTEGKTPKPEGYDFVQTFDAPTGNPRDIVVAYMREMATVKWVATKSWTTVWKKQGDFNVNLSYTRGKTYYGIPYSQTEATLEEFQLFLKDGKFTPNSQYFEELIGNHCSSAMDMAFQQILDFPYTGTLKPSAAREGLLKFPDGIERPDGRSKPEADDWISEDLFAKNSEKAIMNGYASLGAGDILYKNIIGSGHTRLVVSVNTKYKDGEVNPRTSTITVIEQTNAWFTQKQDTTWFVDKKYTFADLYNTLFMPVTFEIYHEDNPVIDDAYIMFNGMNTPESILNTIDGTVYSTFPLTYVRVTITDASGKIVGEHMRYSLDKSYKINLRTGYSDLGIDKLPAGTYTYNLRAGIARGGVDIENFQFTKA